MDRLWAPWRIGYVTQAHKEAACFLCEAAAAKDNREKLVLWRAGTCFSMLNCWPYNNGHMMVAPLAHKADLSDLSDDELLEQMQLLRRCQRNLAAVVKPAGFNVGLNLGRAAGAGVVGHLHWHIVPRWDGDTNFMPVVAEAKVIAQSLESLWELLRQVDGGQ
jgi:ATP adenylyltransferase